MANYIDYNDTDLISTMQGAVDDIINGCDPCIVVYPGTQEACSCVLDQNTQYGDQGVGVHQLNPLCSLCNGSGLRISHVTEQVYLRVNWDTRKFISAVNPIRVYPQGDFIETLGYLSDQPKLIQCQELLVRVSNNPYMVSRFTLISSPVDKHNIVKNRYVYAIWERIK